MVRFLGGERNSLRQNFWGPPSLLFNNGYLGLLSLGTEQQEHEVDHVAPSVPRLRTNGGVPLTLVLHSWLARGAI